MPKSKSAAPARAQSRSKKLPDRKKLDVQRLDDAHQAVLQAHGIVVIARQAIPDGCEFSSEAALALEVVADLLDRTAEQLTEENLLAPAEAQEESHAS
jgi:hypothetical protein